MLDVGQIVKSEHKTGQYIGKVASVDERRVLVEIMAVLRHPQQGDLHSAYDPDAALFHERRASAEREKVWIMLRDAVPYAGEVPPYRESLAAAWKAEILRIDRMRRWSEQCLQCLDTLGTDYGLKDKS